MEDFNCVSNNLNEDVASSVKDIYKQFCDAVRPFKDKNKATVLAQGHYKREHLIDSTFSLKEVCENLFTSVLTITKMNTQSATVSLINDMSNNMHESMAKFMKDMESNIAENSIVCQIVRKMFCLS